MPLPEGGTDYSWPPEDHSHYFQRYLEHSAWYSGDPNQLSDFYAYGYGWKHRAGEALGSGGGAGAMYPSSHSIWRLNFDRFWARITTAPWRRQMLHLPLAADIATTSADLLFSEPVDFAIPGAHEKGVDREINRVQERLDELIEEDGVHATLTEAAETAAALGGVYLRVTWDKDVEAEHPLLTSVDADQAVPEFRWGRLVAVTFWRAVNPPAGMKGTWRHLERHESGFILHGLYQGTDEKLGTSQPIGLLGPDWESDTDLGHAVIPTGIDLLTAVYVPNMRPNRIWRGADLGRSDYDGVEALMDALDEVWTSWMRDMRLARARIMVPQEYMDAQGKGKGAVFDLDNEVFETLPMAVSRDENAITMSQFQIRAIEHQTTALALLERIIAAAGYSESTFGLNEIQRGVTATEIISRERRSYVTRNKKVNYWKRPLKKILEVLLAIDVAQGFDSHEVIAPLVDFADSVQEDPGKMASTVVTLRQAMAASTETLVRMVHDDWTDPQVEAEVQKIMDERALTLPSNRQAGSPLTTLPQAQGRGVGGVGISHTGDVTVGVGGQNEHLPPGSTSGGPGGGS